LRLSAFGNDKEALNFKVDRKADELKQLIGHLIFGEEQDTLEKVIGQMMIEKGFTLATAESCTGGYIAHLITSISGSSAYFKGSIVAYDNEVKKELLEVLESDLKIYGAVSKNVVEAMALGAKKHLKTDFAVATSGIAGPDGGTKDKPVGTVWIAIVSKDNSIQSACYSFGDSRERTIRKAALSALESLRKEILRLS
jgi:nicotinamide-nucleotide amidase